MFLQPTFFPLERVVANSKAYLEAHPGDADAHYTLARAYYLAFANQVANVPVLSGYNDKPDRIAADFLIRDYEQSILEQEIRNKIEAEIKEQEATGFPNGKPDYSKLYAKYKEQLKDWKPEKLNPDQVMQFAALSLEYFEKAIKLKPGSALYYLGLASLQEQVLGYLSANKIEAKDFALVTSETVFSNYWKAFELSKPEDAALTNLPISGKSTIVSYEAGNACLRLGLAEAGQEKALKQHLEKMEHLSLNAVTPLVITGAEVRSPKQYELPNRAVTFDLDGLGVAEWQWVTPETGILVWDPEERGDIRSATQLFGNYTFRMIWRDGFHALSVLDDNADGKIAGSELKGLALWHDRNSNGVSDAGEVRPIEEHGVSALLLEEVSPVEGMPLRQNGVVYESGSTGNLWDWIARQKGGRDSSVLGSL